MTEQYLVELGFEQFNHHDGEIGDWYYFASNWGGVELISNASDEWDGDGIIVSIMETDIQFTNNNDLWSLKELLSNNMK
jgi:predicted phage-related endonuclease